MSEHEDRTPMWEAILRAYEKGQEDETLEPLVLIEGDRPVGRMRSGEPVIFYDIRGEREIQLTRAFVEEEFDEIEREPGLRMPFVTMVEYDRDLRAAVAFPPLGDLRNTLAEILDRRGMRFLKAVESEKAVHMTFYINGKIKTQFEHEDRLIIESPQDVRDFDEKPEMNIHLVSAGIREKLEAGEHTVIMANFANTDVVGHCEDEGACIRAVEAVDREAGRVIETARACGYHVVITADHGTVEKRLYPEGAIDTGHTTSPVPCLWIPAGDAGFEGRLRSGGSLTDITPTILDLLGIDRPEEMTGQSLIGGGGDRQPGRPGAPADPRRVGVSRGNPRQPDSRGAHPEHGRAHEDGADDPAPCVG